MDVNKWVQEYCAVMDDFPTLQIMRCRAIAAIMDKQVVIEALPQSDPDYSEWVADRDELFSAYDRIVARGQELGVRFNNERAYGIRPEKLRKFEKLERARHK